MVKRFRMNIATNVACFKQCFDFRRKAKRSVLIEVVERLYANSITSEKQRLIGFVEYSEREHSTKQMQHVFAVSFVQVHEYFRVRMRSELDAILFEILSELLKVIDLTVECDPNQA